MKKIIIIISFILLIVPEVTFAHSGRTDSSGCHTCRTNCASWGLSSGEYHCHRAKSSAPQPIEPVKSHKVENGTGYTIPAPEYKTPVIKDATSIKETVKEKETNDNSLFEQVLGNMIDDKDEEDNNITEEPVEDKEQENNKPNPGVVIPVTENKVAEDNNNDFSTILLSFAFGGILVWFLKGKK